MKFYERGRRLLPPWREPEDLPAPEVHVIEAEEVKPPVPDAQVIEVQPALAAIEVQPEAAVIEVQPEAAAIEIQPETGPTDAPHEAAPIQPEPELPVIDEAPESDSALLPATITQTAPAPSSSDEWLRSGALYFSAGTYSPAPHIQRVLIRDLLFWFGPGNRRRLTEAKSAPPPYSIHDLASGEELLLVDVKDELPEPEFFEYDLSLPRELAGTASPQLSGCKKRGRGSAGGPH